MEIIMINESKLKVMLTENDLQSFEISTDELDYNNTETKRMFWDILNHAKHSIGFDTDGQRVLVQLYPSRDGGCEMFITKIGSVCRSLSTAEDPSDDMANDEKISENEKIAITRENDGEGDTPSISDPILHYKPLRKRRSEKGRIGAFGFDSMEHLLSVCRRLFGIGYSGDSKAYICDNGRSYLILSGLSGVGIPILDEYSFIVEYGTAESMDALSGFIGEHGKLICDDNAVEQLARL